MKNPIILDLALQVDLPLTLSLGIAAAGVIHIGHYITVDGKHYTTSDGKYYKCRTQ